jgi:hypothetical protein
MDGFLEACHISTGWAVFSLLLGFMWATKLAEGAIETTSLGNW